MIIVTGGLGFIGSHLVHALLNTHEHIVVVDTRVALTRFQGRICEVAEFVEDSDIFVFLAGHKPDAIYHLGANSSTTAKGPALFRANTDLTVRLWNWCGRKNVPFLYASSAATYGDGSLGFSDEMGPYEMMELRPLNAYGLSKHLADLTCIVEEHQRLMYPPPHWYGLKFFNVYGPGEEHKGAQQSIISRWVNDARVRKPMDVFSGTTTAQRDFIAVSDVVEVMLWLMHRKPTSGIYNVGTGIPQSFGDVAQTINEFYPGSNLNLVPFPPALVGQYQSYTCASTAKLRAAGYPGYPMKTLKEGIEAYES